MRKYERDAKYDWHGKALPKHKKPLPVTEWSIKLTVRDVQNLDALRVKPEFAHMTRLEVFRRLVAFYGKPVV